MIATWTLGLLRRRRGRLAATAAGIAAAVALLACLGSFLAAAQGSMTARAIRSVTVDWQVEVQPDTQPSTVLDTVRSAPNVQAALPVGYRPLHRIRRTDRWKHPNNRPGNGIGHPPELPRAVSRRHPHPGRRRQRGPDCPTNRRQPACGARRHHPHRTGRHRAGRRRRRRSRRPAPGRLAVPEGRRTRRRPTGRTAGQRADPRPSPVAQRVRPAGSGCGPTWSAPRSTPPSTTRCRPIRARPTPR